MPTGLGDEQLWISATNDNTGTSTAFNDLSGEGNDGTASGGMLVVADTSEGGTYAFDFDGVDDEINISSLNNWNDGTEYSFSLWSLADATGSRWYPYRASGSGANREYYSNYGNLSYIHRASNGAGSTGNQTTSQLMGTWIHSAVTYDGTTMRLFIDGVEIDSYTVSPLSAATSLRIGNNTVTTAKMDDIRSYNRVLTQAEITHLASARGVEGTPYEGLGDEQLWLCPSLDDSANDISGNGNNGTYVGGLATTADTGSGGSLAYDIADSTKGVTLPIDIVDGLTEYSYGIWCKLAGGQTSSSNIFGGYNSTNNAANPTFFVSGTDNLRVLGKTDFGSTIIYDIENPATSGVWKHLFFTHSVANGLRTYENGVLVNTYATQAVTGGGAVGFAIGKQQSYGGTVCLTDDARVYHRELTQAEITHLATSRGIEGGPGTPPTTGFYNPFINKRFNNDYTRRIR